MPHISIIAASIRTGRASNRVALFFENFLQTDGKTTVEVLDLQQYNFPLFEERLKFQRDPSPAVIDFALKIKNSDGVIIVTPEYNGGYPASLKNVIDLLYEEWHRKPIAISTVSDGNFGGTQVIISLQFTLWKMRAWTVPAMFPVPNVNKSFDATGKILEPALEKRAVNFVNELHWCIAAKEKMEQQ